MSVTRVAINGFGRIGRSVLRALYEQRQPMPLQVVAINELADIETVSYMLRYDSTHGRFAGDVSIDGSDLIVNGDRIALFHHQTISDCPWQAHKVDVVLECTGRISTRADAEQHLDAGAARVLIANPADEHVDHTVLYGWNHHTLSGSERVVANGSCSTNCLIPLLDHLHESFGIEAGVSTTVHSAMNDQPVIDAYHSDLRRTRSAVQSIIPVDTALHKGVDRLLPHLSGKMESLHVRVPTVNVSALDVSLQLMCDVTAEQVNRVLHAFVQHHLDGKVGITYEPHASIDFNGDGRSGVVDATQTRVAGKRLLKLWLWFDNEWGFANRMLDTANYWSQLDSHNA